MSKKTTSAASTEFPSLDPTGLTMAIVNRPPEIDAQDYVDALPMSAIFTYIAFNVKRDLPHCVFLFYMTLARREKCFEDAQARIDAGTHQPSGPGQVWRVGKDQQERCGAKCRDGHACRASVVVRADKTLSKRCRLHGGLSTGPKTTEGKAAIAQSNRTRKVRRS